MRSCYSVRSTNIDLAPLRSCLRRQSLLSICDQDLASCGQIGHGVCDGLILRLNQIILRDFPSVVVRVRLLENYSGLRQCGTWSRKGRFEWGLTRRSWQAANQLSRNGHSCRLLDLIRQCHFSVFSHRSIQLWGRKLGLQELRDPRTDGSAVIGRPSSRKSLSMQTPQSLPMTRQLRLIGSMCEAHLPITKEEAASSELKDAHCNGAWALCSLLRTSVLRSLCRFSSEETSYFGDMARRSDRKLESKNSLTAGATSVTSCNLPPRAMAPQFPSSSVASLPSRLRRDNRVEWICRINFSPTPD